MCSCAATREKDLSSLRPRRGRLPRAQGFNSVGIPILASGPASALRARVWFLEGVRDRPASPVKKGGKVCSPRPDRRRGHLWPGHGRAGQGGCESSGRRANPRSGSLRRRPSRFSACASSPPPPGVRRALPSFHACTCSATRCRRRRPFPLFSWRWSRLPGM